MSTRASRAAAFLGFALVALFVGRATAQRPMSAVLAVAVPVGVAALLFPSLVLALAVAGLAFPNAVPVAIGGLEISGSDLLLVIGTVGLVLSFASGRREEGATLLRSIAPVAVPVVFYFATMVLAVLGHLTRTGVTTTLQRIELVVLALVAGAALAQRDVLRRAMLGYIAVTSVLAIYAIVVVIGFGNAPETFLGIQKNPAGGAIATALVMVRAMERVPLRLPVGLLLSLGLLSSLSRGAIIGALVAALVVVLVRGPGRRVRDVLALGVITVALVGAFNVLPQAQQDRLLDINSDNDRATQIREDYRTDAIAIIKANRWLGVGPGNYVGGPLEPNTSDPHNVALLTAAEGGLAMTLGAGVLLLGTAWVLLRRIRWHPMVVVALGVQVSTLTHAIVDVYWVRNTPVMGWVLVGAALVLSARSREERADLELSKVVEPLDLIDLVPTP